MTTIKHSYLESKRVFEFGKRGVKRVNKIKVGVNLRNILVGLIRYSLIPNMYSKIVGSLYHEVVMKWVY